MEVVLLILIILWFLGYITVPGLVIPRFPIFYIGVHPITLWDILIFLVIMWAIDILPTPLRQVGWVLVVLWLLSTVGFLAVAGLSSIIVIALIIGLLVSVLGAV